MQMYFLVKQLSNLEVQRIYNFCFEKQMSCNTVFKIKLLSKHILHYFDGRNIQKSPKNRLFFKCCNFSLILRKKHDVDEFLSFIFVLIYFI